MSIHDPNPEQVALAKELCQHLPDYEPHEERCIGIWCMVRHKSGDGRQLSIRKEGHSTKEKYSVHTAYPSYSGSHYRPDDDENITTNIGVSVSRGVEALAKEITRRLLQTYDAAYAKQLAIMQRWIDRENADVALRNEIIEMVGDTVSPHLGKSTQVSCYRHGLNKICVSGGEKVQLTTDYLPKDVAIEVVKLLIERMPERNYG